MSLGGFVSFFEFNDFIIGGADAGEVTPSANGPLSASTGLDITFELPPGAELQTINVIDDDDTFEDDFQEDAGIGPGDQEVTDDVFIDGGTVQIGAAGDFLEVEFTVTVADPEGNEIDLLFAAFDSDADGEDSGLLTMVFPTAPLEPGVVYSFVSSADGGDTTYDELVPCFVRGTRLATPEGERAVEDLRIGDLVTLADGRTEPVRWIGRRSLSAAEVRENPDLAPVRVRANAYGFGVPLRDLVVSPQHRVVVDHWRVETMFGTREVLAPAKSLVDGARVVAEPAGAVEYFHVMFDSHEIVLSEGLATESFHVAEQSLSALDEAARTELLKLFPDLPEKAAAASTVLPTLKAFEGRVLARALD
ncbi:MAG: Hint domain-containing protein [Pseudomonadota bacterium]